MAKPKTVLVYRHAAVTRATHWINVLALTFLLMSGLNIFGAHPALYWGQKAVFAHPWISITSVTKGDDMLGFTQIGPLKFNTTGVLGYSGAMGHRAPVAFPGWATIPGYQDLADSRHYHFFFAWLFVINGVVYLAYTLLSRHLRRDLVPTGPELRALPASLSNHLRLRFPKGEEARHYNVLQKLTYLVVIFGLLPLMVLAGLTMSPALDTAFRASDAVRRTAVGAHGSFHRRLRHRHLRRRARGHGPPIGRLEQSALDGDRPLFDRWKVAWPPDPLSRAASS